VYLLLALLASAIIALALAGVRSSVRSAAGRERSDGALQRAALEQSEFHAQQGRFAIWPELEAAGMGLPAKMGVDASNATSSHWYLRLHDSVSGLLCDRVGTVVDEPTERVPPTCRPRAR
jgi:hypothetical protein